MMDGTVSPVKSEIGQMERQPLNGPSMNGPTLIVPQLPVIAPDPEVNTQQRQKRHRWYHNAIWWRWSTFDSDDLEALYCDYAFKLRLRSLVSLLALTAVLTVVLAAVDLAFTGHATVSNVVHIKLCAVCVLSLVYVHTPYMQVRHLPVVAVILLFVLCCFTAVSLPVAFGDRPADLILTPADGAWQVAVAVFLLYGLQSLHIVVVAVVGALLPLAHVLVTVLFTEGFPIEKWAQVCNNIDTTSIYLNCRILLCALVCDNSSCAY